MADLATTTEFATAWRPLRPSEIPRAAYWIGVASRKVRRRWRDVEDRIAAGDLARDDVRDVVLALVNQVLGPAPVPGAKSWQEQRSSGEESRSYSVTMSPGKDPHQLMVFEEWMLEIFDGSSTGATPTGCFPPAARWPEGS
ncbi:hypothetical protein [Georgenia wangjunii]|uniref:hypothetical protein n=1 Tax=Georgenia wangjunii TaxID=3117730 RepID=UPI002F260C75